MGRRLVKHGESTLMVSLPSKWIKAHGYRKGDEIEIIDRDGELVIGAKSKERSRKCSITLAHAGMETYRSILGGYYRLGYDEMDIHFSKRSFLDVQRAVDSLYGFEIIDLKETSCRAIKVFNEGGMEPDTHLKRIIFALRSMQKLLFSDIEKNHKESGDELLQLRNSVLKERDLIGRLVAGDARLMPYYAVALNLWNTARCYQKMHMLYTECKPGHLKHLKNASRLLEMAFPDKGQVDTDSCDRKYRQWLREANDKINDGGPIITYTIAIILLIQSCLSHLVFLHQHTLRYNT